MNFCKGLIMNKRKKYKKRLVKLGVLAIVFIWLVWGNVTVKVNTLTVTDADLPEAFAGYKIAQISDLHNAEFGRENRTLIGMLERQTPDMIVITGDMVDSNHMDVDVAIEFAENIAGIAPCYYITGNHEGWLETEYDRLEKGLINAGVMVLHDEAVVLEKGGESIRLIGMDDPTFRSYHAGPPFGMTLQKLKDETVFTILLSHRPERFDAYVQAGVDLVFSGHAHGGQFRIPFVGGLVAPDQGVFPEYDAGVYTEGTTTMVVSRGIGNSIIPVRINNRPELVVVELQKNR